MVRLELAVSTSTSALQLERLQARLKAFTEEDGSAYKPGVFFRVRGIADGNLLLSVWAQSRHSWGAVPDCYRGIFDLWIVLLREMRAEGIVCQLANQTIDVRGADAAAARELAARVAEVGGRVVA